MPAAFAGIRRQWSAFAAERSAAELRWLGVILALAFALRLAWVLYAMREPQGVHDPAFYIGYGVAIAGGGGYQLPAVPPISAGPTAYYPVGYSAALGAIFALLKQSPLPENYTLANGYFQIFLGVVSVYFVYEIGRRLFTPAVGLLAAAWLAVFPNLIFHTATFLTETLFIFLILAAILALITEDWRERTPGPARLAVFAVLLAASAYVRPISLLLIPLVPALWLYTRLGWQRALRDTALIVAVTVAAIAPWTVRNLIRMDGFVIMSTNFGDNLCMGHQQDAPGHFALPQSCFPEPGEKMSRPEFEVGRNSENTEKAIEFALDNTVAALKLLSRKAYYLWEHDHDGLEAVESYGADRFLDDDLRVALRRIADIFFFFTISVGALGLVGLVLGREPRRIFFLLSLLALAGIPLVFFGDARFHVPVLPLLVVPAAWMVLEAVRLVRAAPARPSAVVVAADREGASPHEDAL